MPRAAALRAARSLAPRPGPTPWTLPITRRPLHSSTKRLNEVLATAAKLPEAEPIPPQKPKESITINDVLQRRAKAGKLVAGTAAYSDSDMFKAPVSLLGGAVCVWKWWLTLCVQSIGKPKAKRWDRESHLGMNLRWMWC